MKKLLLLLTSLSLMEASERVYINISTEVGGLNFQNKEQQTINTTMSSVMVDSGIIKNDVLIGCRARIINNSCIECSEENIGSGYSIDAKIGISDSKQSFSYYGLISYLDYDFINNNEIINNDVGYGFGAGASIKLSNQPFNSVPNALMVNYIYYNMNSDELNDGYNIGNLSVGVSWSF